MAYRGAPDAAPRAPQNDVLEEIVHQFADTYAFVRELVQNAIDAGATKIRLLVDERDGVVFTSVEDDGSGMTLAIIEGPLLTAFSSGKEGDAGDGKIGKYGVGFLSVFALNPARVVVSTSTDTVAHDVVILPDHSYSIEERPPARRGTTVTIVAGGGATEGRDAQARRVEEAATKWCLHVRVPVVLVVDGGPEKVLTVPFSIDSPVCVEGERNGVRVVVGVGRARGRARPAAFYHSGLLLHETADAPPALPFVVFKAESARFQHTISRDGVRADKAYAQALDLAGDLAKGPLRDVLRPAAARAADDDGPTPEARQRSVDVCVAAARLLAKRHVSLPLAVPSREGARSIKLGDVGDVPPDHLFCASEPSFVAEIVSAAGGIVLRDDGFGSIRAIAGGHARSVDEVTVAVRVEGADGFLMRVGAALGAAGAAFTSVALARVEGPVPARATWLLERAWSSRAGFAGWLIGPRGATPTVGPTVVLIASAPPIAYALDAADEHAAAALVARLVLVEACLANPSSSERLLGWAATAASDVAP
ncbi:MAG: ATP-binding protein [Polyangiaceae bacterium]